MVHLKWALVALLSAGVAYGYAWFTKPNQTPAECIQALDLNRRIDDARESVNRSASRPVPSQTISPDVANLNQLAAEFQTAEQHCRDAQ